MKLRLVRDTNGERERREAYVDRHERADGSKDTLYEQSRRARYRSDIRASKRQRAIRRREIRTDRIAERRSRAGYVLKGVGVVATAVVITLSVGRGLDGLAQEQERRDNYALNAYKELTGVDPTKDASTETDQGSDTGSQTASEATVTSTVYDTAEEAQQAVEDTENGSNAESVDTITAPVEPSAGYPEGGVEVIQIQENGN